MRFGAGPLTLLLAGAPALLQPLSEAELARRAERILVGRVVAVAGHWNADRSRIFTRVELKVERALKGAATATAALEILGGTVGTLTSEVGAAPRFTVGEEVLVFTQSLEEAGWRYETVLGWAQGKFRLVAGDGSTPVRLERDFTAVAFSGDQIPPAIISLDQLERSIRAELQAP